jgi:hypothetical protein
MRDRGMSSKDVSKEESSHNLKPKSIEELVEEVLVSNKTT